MSIIINNPVYIRVRKAISSLARRGQGLEDDSALFGVMKIGSGFGKGGSPLRAVDLDEERRHLPAIVGLTPKSENWNKVVSDYWADFGKTIPTDSIGQLLEAGLSYETQEDADKAIAEEDREAKNIENANANGAKYEEIFEVRGKLGTPLNMSDYLVWRYCLKYSAVANSIDDVGASPKIRFYLMSKSKEAKVQKTKLQARKKAYAKYLDVIANSKTVSALIYMFAPDIQRYNRDKSEEKKLVYKTDLDKDLTLEKLSIEYPDRFLFVSNDTQLMEKAFVERAIEASILRRLPNTDIIFYGDNTQIGRNILEAVDYFKNPANTDIFNTVKGRLSIKDENTAPVNVTDPVIESIDAETANVFQPPPDVTGEKVKNEQVKPFPDIPIGTDTEKKDKKDIEEV